MDQKPVACNRTTYAVDHHVIDEATEEAVIDAYEDELEWAERNQASDKPDMITQKNEVIGRSAWSDYQSGGVFMAKNQHPEIPIVDLPNEILPVDQPEVEIVAPHPQPDSPGAVASGKTSNPMGFIEP